MSRFPPRTREVMFCWSKVGYCSGRCTGTADAMVQMGNYEIEIGRATAWELDRTGSDDGLGGLGILVFWIARVGDGVRVVERGMLMMGMAMIGNRLDSHGCQAGWFYGCHIYFYCIVCVLCLPPKWMPLLSRES